MTDTQLDFQCLYCQHKFGTKREVVEHVFTSHGDVTIRKDGKSSGQLAPYSGQQQVAAPVVPAPPFLPSRNPASMAQLAPAPIPTISALPAAIASLGLSANDFDPLNNSQWVYTTMTVSTYIDIPDFYNIPDEHMFNACPRKILGYGNLLRLAARYSTPDLVVKININRPTAVIGVFGLRGRINKAYEWAAGKEWFPGTEQEVRAWLAEKRKANGIKG